MRCKQRGRRRREERERERERQRNAHETLEMSVLLQRLRNRNGPLIAKILRLQIPTAVTINGEMGHRGGRGEEV